MFETQKICFGAGNINFRNPINRFQFEKKCLPETIKVPVEAETTTPETKKIPETGKIPGRSGKSPRKGKNTHSKLENSGTVAFGKMFAIFF